MPSPHAPFDRARLRLRRDRAARSNGTGEVLHARAADDLVWRLEGILRDFPLAVDLGARRGAFAAALAGSSAAGVGALIEADLSPAMLAGRGGARVAADEERLPFAAGSLDLIVSTLSLHWVNDLPGALVQARRALKPDGLFLAAMFGGATLNELRLALLEAEAEVTGGAAARVAPLVDPRDAAGLLQRAGFTLPAADVDRVRVRYPSVLALMADLRATGETAAMAGPVRPLRRDVLAEACRRYPVDADGRISATFEIVTLTGWAPAMVR